jgi:general secretion pathway protein H
MSRTGDKSFSQNGFTLIEIVVVLAVMALIMAMAMPMLTGAQSRENLQASARTIAAALRSSRNRAMTDGHAEIFVVDTAHNLFRPAGSRTAQRIPSDVRMLLTTTTDDRIDATTGSIRFFADGSATGGAVRLSNGKASLDVLVDWLTGYITIGNEAHAAAR